MVPENSDSTRSDADSGGGRITFEWSGLPEPSTAVAEAVAAATDREPTELEPIHESVDTDALDKLVAPTDTERGNAVNVSFRYEGVDVVVDSRCGIEVRPSDEDASE